MAGMDAAMEAETVVRLAISVKSARKTAQRDGRAELGCQVALLIAAISQRYFAAQAVIRRRALGEEVHQPAHLARPIDRRRRPAQNLDTRGVGQGRGIGAAVLRPLEAAEIIVRQGAAQAD